MADEEQRGRVESAIRAARLRGDFDDLPGKGKPLELEELAGGTPEQRFDALLMRSCGEVSVEVALVREIRAARAKLEAAEPGPEAERLQRELQAKTAELADMLKASRGAKTK